MADTLTLESIQSATVHRELSSERITENYLVIYEGATVTNVATAYSRALAVGLPTRTTFYSGTSLFFESASPTIDPKNRNVWMWAVTWSPLPPGKSGDSFDENPLDRPPEYGLRRRETDYPIVTGKNVEVLARANGGGQRAADTSGRIVNAAGEEPDEQPLDTVSNPIVVISRNYPSLQPIANLNTTYQLTTNSAAINDWPIRRLKFLAAEDLGRKEENGVVYFPCEISIEVMATTDLKLDNVGWHAWRQNDAGGETTYELDRAKVKHDGKEVDVAAPINLNLDGTEGTDDSPTSITYRYLDPVSYSPLFT